VKLPTVIKGVEAAQPAPAAVVLPATGAPDEQAPLLAGLMLVGLGGALLISRRGRRA
jgi:LPXTG-motif cell wall-anchored protein